MIYYFSGTGNSKEVAERIAQQTHDYAVSITYCSQFVPDYSKSIGFVFPIYAWGIPKIMKQFISTLQWSEIPPYIFMVCTCGDDIGKTDIELRKLLKRKHLNLDAAWSLIMPNTYVALPGFDIDPQEIAQQKIEKSFERISEISQCINAHQRHVFEVTPGKYPWLKSHIIRPLFNLFLTGDKKFVVNNDCTHCGICAKQCPTGNINFGSNGKPYWNGDCANCFTCYHSCPQHAINYGNSTKNKGQYLFRKFWSKIN